MGRSEKQNRHECRGNTDRDKSAERQSRAAQRRLRARASEATPPDDGIKLAFLLDCLAEPLSHRLEVGA